MTPRRQRLIRILAGLLIACSATAGSALALATPASSSLTIQGFITHFFSHAPVGHGQIAGYDSSLDGVIEPDEESERVDRKQRVWTASRFLKGVYAKTGGDDGFISKDELQQYLRSFDTDGDGRIETNGEFQRLYRAVWHKQAPRTASYGAFERRFYG